MIGNKKLIKQAFNLSIYQVGNLYVVQKGEQVLEHFKTVETACKYFDLIALNCLDVGL